MTVAVAVAAAAAVTGNQDITTSDLGGETPKACILLYGRGAVSGTIGDHSNYNIGVCDGTNQRAASFALRNGTSGANRVGKTDKIIMMNGPTTGVIESEAAFVEFITNGVRINWTTASADGFLITALFFSGSDWTAAVGDSSATIGAGTTVALGWQPDAVFLFGQNDTFGGAFNYSRATMTVGCASFPNGTRKEVFHAPWSPGNRQNAVYSTASASAYYVELFGQYGVAVSRSATGFSLIAGAGTGAQKFGYLALKFDGIGRMSCGALAISTAGNQPIGGFNGAPGGFLMLLTQAQPGTVGPIISSVSLHTETKSGGFSIGGLSSLSPPSTPPAHFQAAVEDEIVKVSAAGAVSARGTLDSWDSDGITLDFSNAPDAAYQWLYWTILDYVAPGGGGGGGPDSFGWIID